jgi:hypothetical protein
MILLIGLVIGSVGSLSYALALAASGLGSNAADVHAHSRIVNCRPVAGSIPKDRKCNSNQGKPTLLMDRRN